MKKLITLCFLMALVCAKSWGQTTISQGFENAGALPSGWTVSSGSYLSVVGSGTNPTQSPHGGSYQIRWNSYSAPSGTTANLYSPSFDLSTRGSNTPTITLWFYRDVSSYNTSTYAGEGVNVMMNTTASATGGTTLGFIPRNGITSASGTYLATSANLTTTTSGWYSYVFNIPTSYNTSSNFVVFNFVSRFGNNCFLDDVSYVSYPSAITLSATSLTSFGSVCTNTTAGPNSFTVSGSNLTGNVTVNALAGFTYSTTSGGTYTNTLTLTPTSGTISQAVYVKFTPVATQSYDGNIVLSGGGASSVNVAASGTGVNSPPTVSSAGTAGSLTINSASITGSTISALGCTNITAYGIEYSTTSGFANGAGIKVAGTGFSGVAGGTFSTSLTGLASGTTYYFKAYATNSGGTSYNSSQGSFTTLTPRVVGAISATQQATGNIGRNTTNNNILRISIPVTGSSGTFTLNSVTVNSANTSDADIAAGGVKLWTGTASAPSTQIGTAQSFSGGVVTFSGLSSTTYSSATTNYLWVTYDITATATLGNLVDATLPAGGIVLTASGDAIAPGTQPTSTLNPSGSGTIAIVYCVPAYTSGTSLNDYIAKITYAGISNSTGASSSPYYTLYSTPVATVVRGVANNFTITVNSLGGDEYVGMWIDLDDDGVFSTSERFINNIRTSSYTLTTPITIPISAAGGNHRMRVRISYSSTTNFDPCASYTYGETEDYIVNVLSCTTSTVTVSPGSSTICAGSSVTLSASGATTYSWSPATGLNTTSGATVIATPTVSTTYVVIGSTGACSSTATASIVVNASPAAFTITPATATICAGSVQQLTANNVSQTTVLINEKFNGIATGWTQDNLSTGGTPDNAAWAYYADGYNNGSTTFHSNDNSQFVMSNSDAQGNGGTTLTYLYAPVINTTGFASLSLNFYQYYKFYSVSANDSATVQVSTDNTTWTTVRKYTGADAGTATSFSNAVIDLASYVNKPTLYIRFKYTSAYGWYWAIDNVTVSGTQSLAVSWSPVTDLYTNAAATTAYTAGTSATTVYAKPSGNVIYTATAATNADCSTTTTSTLTVNPLPTASISAATASVCSGTGTTVTITGTAGNKVAYKINTIIQDSVTIGSNGTYAINTGSLTANTTYTLLGVSNGNCSQSYTSNNTVSITVKAAPALFSMTGGGAYCEGSEGSQIGLNGSEAGVNYTLLYNNSTMITTLSGTGAALDFGYQTGAGSYTVTATHATSGCTVTMSGNVSVTITPTPDVYTVGGGGVYCAGASGVSITLTGSQAGVNYLLKLGNTTVQTKAGTGTALTFTNVTAAGTYTVRTGGSCVAFMNGSATVTINPLPTASISGTNSVCQNAVSPQITFTGANGTAPYTFSYTISGDNTAHTVVSSGSTATVSVPTATAGTVIYTLVSVKDASSISCTNTASGSATITVNPAPVASIVTPASSACAGSAVGVAFSGTPNADIMYTLDGVAQPSLHINANGDNVVINSPSNEGTYQYIITSVTLGSCSGNAGSSTTITIHALPGVSPVTGNNYVATGRNLTLYNATTGGVWAISSADASIESQSSNPAAVILHGESAGTPTVTYTTAPNEWGCTNTASMVVNVYNPSLARFRTIADGYATNPAIWEVFTGVPDNWEPASEAPTNNSNIEVRHNVSLLYADFKGSASSSFIITEHDENGSSVAGMLTIAPNHYFQSLGAVNFNHHLVVLKSDATGTASIGEMSNGSIANATNVQVERYIGLNITSTHPGRAWRLLTAPVSGTTINAAWQEGQLWDGTGGNPPSTGYGTLITGYVQNNAANANSHGYDFWPDIYHSNSSIRAYVPGAVNGSWQSMSSISGRDISDKPAYMLFVRGDRSITTGAGATTLRATGILKQGPQTLAVAAENAYTLVGNPYASLIDFDKVYTANASVIQNKFLMWSAGHGTYGAYTLIDGSGGSGYYTTVPFPMGATLPDDNARYIPSGAGFFVYPNAGGNLVIDESAKSPDMTASINPFRENAFLDKKLYVNLNIVENDTTSRLADGFLARFDAAYSTAITSDDVTKQGNFNENLAIESASGSLMVEARPEIAKTDTLQLKLWNVTKRGYQLQMKAERFDSLATLHAWLEDRYLGTKEEISLSGAVSSFSFAVTSDSLSWKADRFRIVFQNQGAVLPVTLTSLTATAKEGGVEVGWTVSNEVNMKGYTLQRSTDGGRTFTAIAAQEARNAAGAATASYTAFDASPLKGGDNLYRIRMEEREGGESYSQVVKVTIGEAKGSAEIVLYPNPVREGRAWLQLSQLAKGSYALAVYSAAGQRVYERKIVVGSGSVQTEEVKLGKAVAAGSYTLVLTNSNGEAVFQTQMIVVQ